MLCVENLCYIDIVNVLTWQVVQAFKLFSCYSHILDIAKLATANQYALGLFNGGVQTVEIRKTGKSFQLSELTLFLKGEDVRCIYVLPDNCLLVGVWKNQYFGSA